ncbi:golvesin C-terminal-like domain-containing protein [Wenzhouxiangella marina]|uniref:Uncharacterized protein n=1 Tax=Wenzhouxiangella marina TaxID=1579979 RepID=A0A0K0XWZ1_9GAMM|nr:hypothetical protein [Wenzhouxiangella marina]AKS42146.1 hypothetical protein WM2015_1779 [Wenzhouxiangella marina]MBB6086082.1 N-acetylmuramoyl-L-alanine amidase [Wenzhouxiangella marina]
MKSAANPIPMSSRLGLALLFLLTFSLAQAGGPLLWIDAAGRDHWPEMSTPASGSPEARLRALLEQQLAGPGPVERAAGFRSILPEAVRLVSAEVDLGRGAVVLELPDAFLDDQLDDVALDRIARWISGLVESVDGLQSLHLQAQRSSGGPPRPLTEFLRVSPVLDKPEPPMAESMLSALVPAPGQGQPVGALSGASVFLSPGHGWYYSDVLGRWATQRGNTHGLVEDLSNAEAVLQYLVQYLWNAGARVYTVRERDLQTEMVIVDQGDPGYSDSGGWTELSGVGGAYGGVQRQVLSVAGPATASAHFTPTIPEDGFYSVYVWFRPAPSGTTTAAASITIHHSGGQTEWTQDQNRDGYTWKHIGRFHFTAGTDPASASVEIHNSTGSNGDWVIADAVRFGGGMGDLPDDQSGTTSGYPRWEESGRYFAGFMGKSDWAASNTVSAMPRYAAWEHESWEAGRSVYVSWHTNAPDPGRGTSSYAYSSAGFNGPFDGVPGGLELRNAIHDQLINDIRAGWDPNWTDRGQFTNFFGEVNPSHNPEMPASLHEIAFHDTLADAVSLKHPRFRNLAARAVYQGIVDFYHDHLEGFENPVHLPEPPQSPGVRALGATRVRLSWQASPHDTGDGLLGGPAEGYRVYRSADGKGFDEGLDLGAVTEVELEVAPAVVEYFRVSAYNAGGESFPTRTLAVRTSAEGLPAVLIVDGFDRIDSSANLLRSIPTLGLVERGLLERMNTFDYVIAHGEAIAAHGRAFDSIDHQQLIDGLIDPSSYHTLVWIAGEESTADRSFDPVEQSRVSEFMDGGGRLFVSGAEIGWDLVAQGNGPGFFSDQLHAIYDGDDANGYSAVGVAGSAFGALAAFDFDDGSEVYDVRFPDRISPGPGASLALNYAGTGSGGAAIQFAGGVPERRLIYLGFPFESIVDASVRAQLMALALGFLDTPSALPEAIFADRFE